MKDKLIVSLFAFVLFGCPDKNCENTVNGYISFDPGVAVTGLKLSVGLGTAQTVNILSTDTQLIVNTYQSIYTVDRSKSCPDPKIVPELTTNVFICISQNFYGMCKNETLGKIKITGAPAYNCPAGYTLESKYNSGC